MLESTTIFFLFSQYLTYSQLSTSILMYKHIFAVITLLCWLYTSFAQLSFVPDDDFYDIEQATDLTISCLYNGGVDDRVNWMEGSVVLSNSLLNLSNVSLGNHEFICRFTPETGSMLTKPLTVNVYSKLCVIMY